MTTTQGYAPIPGADDSHDTLPINEDDGSQSDLSANDEEGPGWPVSSGVYHDMGEEREQLQSLDDSEGHKRSTKKRLRRCLCIFGTIFFVLLLLSAVAILVVLLIIVGQQPARVVTTCGAVEGKYEPINKVFVFKGIPFASPPTNDRRWRPPEPLKNDTCWKGIYKADTFKPMCAQQDMRTREVKGSEDCLYLNIYTPAVDPSTPLPVMVYIHGGYLQWGDSFTDGYSPDESVTNQLQVVFVSIQYRLNAFGFLVLEELKGQDRRGNYGLLDQVEALRWVKNNIAGFGGDPNQVTIFGQSSGGTSVWALLMSPMAKGLFSRAWMLSASSIYNQTTEQAMAYNKFFTENERIVEHCEGNITEECLMSLSVHDILNGIYPSDVEPPAAGTWDILKDSMDLPILNYYEPALTVVDGEFMPEDPYVMLNDSRWQGKFSDVPLVIGTTAQEIDLDPAPGIELKSWTLAEYENYVGARLNPFGNNITNQSLSLYPYNHNPELAFTNMTTDVRITCGTQVQSDRLADGLKSSVFKYVVTSRPSKPVHPLGIKFGAEYAFHMWDCYGFFGSINTIIDQPNQDDDAFRQIMQTEVMEFVKTGKMNPDWAPYPNMTALLGTTIRYVPAYHEEQCNFWLKNNFFGYAWIN